MLFRSERIESTVQICKSNGDGTADYSYDLGDKGGGSGVIFLDESFPDQKPGSAAVTGYSFDEEGVASLRIETAVLNEDGTVTFAVYRVKR